jgi:hypothetical protein
MPFELPNPVKVAFTNANVRRELHGEEHVRAVDIAMTLKGENTLLDLFEPGLREHHFCNKALQAGQEALPDVLIPLPNLRFPKLPVKCNYAHKQRLRGYRFVLDFGLGGDSNLDFSDCVLTSQWYEICEGGSVTVGWTIQYNGDELQDDATYGRIAGLATVGEGHVQVIAPPTLVLVKGKAKYRSGRPDTAATGDDATGDLLAGADGEEEEGSDDLGAGTPEGAFAATAG